MATFAARRLTDIAENVRDIVAIELLEAAQGVDFRRPLKGAEVVEQAHALLREQVAYYDQDRFFAPDITAAGALIYSGKLGALVSEGAVFEDA